ncbi:hypothetical protein [Pseudoduganella albidiflava]|uniref:Uncharacterized protein n=1 Tax=Pseudoduganella albidiflava TaxID=321983 RepID=A0A411X2T2_9BURK|nr:hypothetical protein [Pseudoduganella albidiflava]QBI03299.1 hypothetical protein EYF70_22580 [Pseudoduganella albidiflava]GGY67937.1 hypothetical protein GCM10007387_57650 [Pseudoduganella albidiflava]
MVTVDVQEAVAALAQQADASQKQVKFATRVALTRTAQKAAQAQVKEMRDIFHSPTPYTLSSMFVRPATAQRLSAEVKLKDDATKATPAAKFLAAQIDGGTRAQKRFERALQAVGAMPPGFRAVPGAGAKLDAYGNISRGQIVQILAFFQAFPEAGYKANMTAASRARLARGTRTRPGVAYFVGSPGDRLPLGIWQRINFAQGSAIKPVLLFVRTADYQPIYDFRFVAEKTIEQEFAGEFEAAYAEAQRTAR